MKKIICLILVALMACLTSCQTVISENDMVLSEAICAGFYVGDKAVDDNTEFFENVIWEPGYCAIETFTVKNEGTLAFDYSLKLEFTGGSPEFLSCLRVAVIENYSENITREEVLSLFEDLDSVMTVEDVLKWGMLDIDASEDITVAVYFVPELSDGVAQEDTVGTDIKPMLLITQAVAENDSFDNQYDPVA